jgi:ribosome-associated translation inhibitor RaiA
MAKALETTFRHIAPSPALTEWAEGKANKLSERHSHATRCRLVVEGPPGHHRHGAPFHIRLEVVVEHEPPYELEATEEDPFVAVTKVFDHAERRLTEHEKKRRDLRDHPPKVEAQGGEA